MPFQKGVRPFDSGHVNDRGIEVAVITTPKTPKRASLITVATEVSGAPMLLISRLARHMKNLSQVRASILFEAPVPRAILCKARG